MASERPRVLDTAHAAINQATARHAGGSSLERGRIDRRGLPDSPQSAVLPAAVLTDFAVCIASSELNQAPLATASLLLVAAIALTNVIGLVGTAVIGTIVYVLAVRLAAS